MDVDSMESEADALKRKSEELQSLSSGSISLSVSNLSASSRVIPSDEDFHFYYNFNEFRCPIDEIAAKSQLMLQQIGSAKQLWGEEAVSPEDMDDGYEWLVNVNDEVFERFDMSVDEFLKARKAAEEGEEGAMNDDGFQLVYGKKKNKAVASVGGGMRGNESVGVKVVERDNKVAGPKPKVPFHIPTIRKPQEEFKIVANNSNEPFQHVWLERIEDGSRFIHPLEKLDVLDFIDHNIEHLEPLKPSSLESTPFKLVEEVRDLKELAAHLRCVNEFAVDLEHNQYRSFQGLTCLMQVSTRTEDFIVDTLKLRTHVGPYLREVFKDPTKRKVMHGADRDITWLQKDFSIYVCNLFDTGQASRVLKLERNSLEYLLQHFCGVTANKEYQNADWRLRPLPREMIRYAREDTHYLLYIYDLMRIRLHSESTAGKRDALLVEVYKRSYDICLQLYEKELLTDTSYLYIYGLQSANFNAQQLAIVAGLYEWRDVVAREEDESTGYILPNKTLLEIAKQIPLTTNKLRRFVRSKQPYVERNLGSVVSIIRHSIQNAAAFEIVAQQLREGLIKAGPKSSAADTDRSEASLCSEYSRVMKTADAETEGGSAIDGGLHAQMETLLNSDENVEHGGHVGPQKNPIQDPMMDIHQSGNMMNSTLNILEFSKDAGAMVNVMKKPGSPFGALLGSSMIKAKNNSNRKDKEENKLEQIKSSVNLPFHSFKFRTQQSEAQEDQSRNSGPLHTNTEESPIKSSTTNREDIIPLEDEQNDLDAQETRDNPSGTEQAEASKSKYDEEDEPMSLSDLSSSFRKCLESVNENHKTKQSGLVQFEPFDYEAARKQVKFGGVAERDSVVGDDGEGSTKRLGSSARKKGSSGVDQSMNDGGGLRQGRRRQAFPASGNRSATFR